MAKPTIAELYTYYDTVSSENATQEEKELAYRGILAGTKGDDKEKRLACQFIARFSKKFENLKEESFNCILDLCDDDDSNIRKQAVHDLLQLCKRIPAFIPRVADVLVQMFQSEDSALLHLEPKATLAGIFNQMLTVNPDNPREHIMKFLSERLKHLPENLLTTEVEEFVVDQTNKVLTDVSEEEFQLLISILSSLKCMSSVPGRQKLVCMISDQALQACPQFNATDPACVAQIRESCRQAALCVSKNVHATELFNYLLQKVIPVMTKIPNELADDRLSLLRAMAEFSTHHGPALSAISITELTTHMTALFDTLVHFLPEIPTTESGAKVTESEKANESETPEKLAFPAGLKFSELECLLYVACQLGRCRPQFYGGFSTEEERETPEVLEGIARLKLVRPRLQYLGQVAHEYAQSIAGNLTENGQSEDNKTKVFAHRVVTNIQNLVRNFFHNPPAFKTSIILSWLQPLTPISPGSKRPASVSLDTDTKQGPGAARKEQPRYVPPAGQWSRGDRFGWNNTSGDNRRRAGGASGRIRGRR
ncbi:unnamed protein product [Echinostoma caproni]|uniref:Apoptosis inhibitor 5 n=1 Tax=Echinostoma caproni TaxID=27848 RepID=A0A183AGC3_9TREM|nr:unnamed protein product [Echinostoma caproni]